MQKILTILTFFLVGCSTTSKRLATNPIAESNKDVLILSTLIRDHLRQTNGRSFTLTDLYQNDSLKRISNNFERIELEARKGYISVYFTFSGTIWKNIIELSSKEKEMLLWNSWSEEKNIEQNDGEIRFSYGELSYRIKKIAVKRVQY